MKTPPKIVSPSPFSATQLANPQIISGNSQNRNNNRANVSTSFSTPIANPQKGVNMNLMKFNKLKHAVSDSAFKQINNQLADKAKPVFSKKHQIVGCGKCPLFVDRFLFLADTAEFGRQLSGMPGRMQNILVACLEALSDAAELNWFHAGTTPSGGIKADWHPCWNVTADADIAEKIRANTSSGQLHFVRFSADEAGHLSNMQVYSQQANMPIFELSFDAPLPDIKKLKRLVSERAFKQINKQLADKAEPTFAGKNQIASCGKCPLFADQFLFLADTSTLARQINGMTERMQNVLAACLEALSNAEELNWHHATTSSEGLKADWHPCWSVTADASIAEKIRTNTNSGQLHFISFSADETGHLSNVQVYAQQSEAPIFEISFERKMSAKKIKLNPLAS